MSADRRRLGRFRTAELAVLIGAAAILAYAVVVGALIYLRPPPVRFVYVESALTGGGEMVFRREGCLSCHELFGNGTTFGPALDGVGSRRGRDWLRDYLRDPRPGVGDRPYRLRMPSYGALDDEEIESLVSYLVALRALDAHGGIIEPSRSRPDTGT